MASAAIGVGFRDVWLGWVGWFFCVGGEREKLVQSNLPTPVLKDSLSH